MFDGTGDGSDDDASDDAGDDDGGSTDPDSTDEGTSDPGGPEVFELFVDPPTLQEDGLVTLTAHVTDPDGLEDIVGGVLVESSSGALIDSFVQISEGSFEVVVSWNALDAVEPIWFAVEGAASLRVEFVDQAELAGTRTIDIPFDCGGDDFGVCGDGMCRELGTSTDCGGCNDACMWCENATCIERELSTCFAPGAGLTCADVCASQGYASCLEDCWLESQYSDATIAYYSSLADCRAQLMASPVLSGNGSCQAPIDPYPAARCCCGPI